MTTSILTSIKKKELQRKKLIAQLSNEREMVRGAFCKIVVKCGKDNCRCKNGIGHPHQRMSFRRDGKAYQRAVPKEDHEWIQKATDQYHEFRALRKEIEKLEKEISDLLDSYEEMVVKKSQTGKPYLEV